MTILFTWALAFVSLGAAVFLTALAYRFFRSDIGLDGWKKELVVIFVLSMIQAGMWAAVAALVEDVPGDYVVLISLVTVMGYKITHLRDMEYLEIMVITGFQALILLSVALSFAVALEGSNP